MRRADHDGFLLVGPSSGDLPAENAEYALAYPARERISHSGGQGGDMFIIEFCHVGELTEFRGQGNLFQVCTFLDVICIIRIRPAFKLVNPVRLSLDAGA